MQYKLIIKDGASIEAVIELLNYIGIHVSDNGFEVVKRLNEKYGEQFEFIKED
jgi:hypothetical protein